METKLKELIKELEKEKANAQDVLDNENVHPDCKQQREGYIIAFSFIISKVQKILNDLPDKRSELLRFCDYLKDYKVLDKKAYEDRYDYIECFTKSYVIQRSGIEP
jgi:hypothetical protein